jgi:threo-3-hydroxy-L-aspartate ammonia-lyase
VTTLVDVGSVRDAARGLRGVAVRTPLLPALWLQERVGADVRLKCESFQPIGAFKLRGAYTMVARLDPSERAKGVVTYSSGNHAQAVAFAARAFGIDAVIVMPEDAPRVKVEGTLRLGAEVIAEGRTSEERRQRAETVQAERGVVMIPPFDHPDIIAGQGTVGLEILEDWPDVETILVPIGGGGLISGVAAFVKRERPDIRVVGVEPTGAPTLKRSVDAGEIVTLERSGSIADGLIPVRPGPLTFAHVRDLVDDLVLVDDNAIRRAAALLLIRGKLLAEYSGAATVAALLDAAGSEDPWNGGRVAAILSGGNIDPARVPELLAAL